MKKYMLLAGLVTFLLSSCSKDSDNRGCIKGKIIYKGLSCHQKWGVQILEGPQIGEHYQSYDNVIEVYNIPNNVYGETKDNDVVEFKIRDTKQVDFEEYNNCPTYEAVYNVSNVKKAFDGLCN